MGLPAWEKDMGCTGSGKPPENGRAVGPGEGLVGVERENCGARASP